jgi:hypothetical protein
MIAGSVAAETSAYQTLLEGHRLDPDNEELHEDLCKARVAMERAWCEAAVGAPSASR